ncbi:Alkaline phosphatase synthesis sensor protein PhoR [compost metagenome]
MTLDPGRLMQVLINLIGNAIKFTPPGGRITVTLEPTPEGARFEVRDTGTGISAVHLPRLFERFYQVDPGNRKAGGAGLGLFISRALVEAHGGQIGVDSTLGEGTRFWFTLVNLKGGSNAWNVLADDL